MPEDFHKQVEPEVIVSGERIDAILAGDEPDDDDREDVSPEEAELIADQMAEEARIAQVLSMGLVSDMIRIKDGDPDKRYVWVRDREIDLEKFKLLGYELESKEGVGVHSTGDTRRKIGDVVLMSIPRDRYNMIERVEQEMKARKMRGPIEEFKKRSLKEQKAGGAGLLVGEDSVTRSHIG